MLRRQLVAQHVLLGAPLRQHERAQAGAVHQHQPQVGAHDERELLANRRVVRHSALECRDVLVVPIRDDPRAQLALAAKVAEHRRLGHPHPLRDLRRGRLFVPLFSKHVAAGAQDVLHALLGFAAGGGAGRVGAIGLGGGCHGVAIGICHDDMISECHSKNY
ncbi:protein of unknown function [Burkholderia multivorans]